VLESAGTATARAPGARLGSALSAATASSQADALREEMKTVEAPACRKLPDHLLAFHLFFSFVFV